MKTMFDLGSAVPTSYSLVRRNTKKVSVAQRERVLRNGEYNIFSFPADLLTLDFLSDSGTSCMTDLQWSSLVLGDESYGRNRGYYLLFDSIRDTFERGDKPRRLIDLVRAGESDPERLMEEIYLQESAGGFVNGGTKQLVYPNAFICPQGRGAEYLLFSTLRTILDETGDGRDYWIPSNGHFDTTEANIAGCGMVPVNLFEKGTLGSLSGAHESGGNSFKGNMNCEELEHFVLEKGKDSIPLIYITITNNTAAGQPVSVGNIGRVSQIAHEHRIPLFLDACRFAENAFFIKQYEPGYQERSIPSIVQEVFSYADGFTISFKKDGLANIGGGLFFRDRGLFHERFSTRADVGVRLKEKQIMIFGNDSYGGLSGRDIMTIAGGLYETVSEDYLRSRIDQVSYFADSLTAQDIPVVQPAGGHAVYLDMDRFFRRTMRRPEDFCGVGLTIELIRHFGIRACELGPFAFDWDSKTEEQRKGIPNFVRFAVPRNVYGKEHIDYAVAAVAELHKNEESIPAVKIARGADLRLRHFQAGLLPVYGGTEGELIA